jgi:hypothetical protein
MQLEIWLKGAMALSRMAFKIWMVTSLAPKASLGFFNDFLEGRHFGDFI